MNDIIFIDNLDKPCGEWVIHLKSNTFFYDQCPPEIQLAALNYKKKRNRKLLM